MSRVEILQKMQLVIQEQMGKEDIVLTEATKLDDLGVDSIELMAVSYKHLTLPTTSRV